MARKKTKATPGSHIPETRRPVSIETRNRKQRDYIKTIQRHDITFGIGSAGTGKTYLAAKYAQKMFTEGDIEKIVICRPAVTAGGEDLGFLPGGINDKMDPFIQPIFDAWKEYWSHSTLKQHLVEGRIEIVPLAYMRGRSFKNAFIIADEMQNATSDNLLMLLTRLDENSKMVITGDPIQSDVNGHSCFHTAEGILTPVNSIGFVKFDNSDVVRHPTVEKILNVWPQNGIKIDNSFEGHTPAFMAAE